MLRLRHAYPKQKGQPMAHDGQDMTMHRVIPDDLIAQTGAALPPLDQLLETATAAVRTQVSDGDRVSGC